MTRKWLKENWKALEAYKDGFKTQQFYDGYWHLINPEIGITDFHKLRVLKFEPKQFDEVLVSDCGDKWRLAIFIRKYKRKNDDYEVNLVIDPDTEPLTTSIPMWTFKYIKPYIKEDDI